MFWGVSEGKNKLAEKMANLTFSIIGRSCNKMVMGKTYWKSVVQPRVLSVTAVMVWTSGGDGAGGADAAGGEQGLETDIGGAGIHAGRGTAGRDRSINC